MDFIKKSQIWPILDTCSKKHRTSKKAISVVLDEDLCVY